jgi:glycosyltransferase involved in cell wall biosynthesis
LGPLASSLPDLVVSRSVYYFTDSREMGGAEQALLILIENLDLRVWRPTLLYNDTPAVAPLTHRARQLGAAVQPVPAMPLGLKGGRRVPALARMLRRARPSVFHAHLSWPLAAKYPLVSAVLARIPAIVTTVQLFPEFRLDRSNYLQERLLATGVGRYIAVSQDVAKRLTETFRWPPQKIEVIHNAVQPERFRRPADPELRRQLTGGREGPLLLTAARLDPQKGLDVLLKAAVRVPAARFVLAGEGPERMRLQSQASELGISDRVLFLGYRTDIPELLAVSDVFVLPSLYEGSSLALLEAMAAGKPVVSSAIGGTDEIIVHAKSGLLVPPANVEALAGALRQVLSDPLLRVKLGTAARFRVNRHFSASVMAKRVTRVYEDLLWARTPHAD